VDPPGLLSIEKQRRLCLSVDHGACAAFRAAKAGRAAVLAPGLDPTTVAVADAARRPVARTAAVVLERPRFALPTTRWPLDRALTQVVLVALMVLAFGALAVSRFSSSGDGGAVASPSASPSASSSPTPRPTQRPSPSPSPSAPASGLPSASASASAVVSPPASPAPSFRATYRVESGDTLVAIAAQFGTTVKAIQDANGLTSSVLKVGQQLNIP
jgi:LysM repeat protein